MAETFVVIKYADTKNEIIIEPIHLNRKEILYYCVDCGAPLPRGTEKLRPRCKSCNGKKMGPINMRAYIQKRNKNLG